MLQEENATMQTQLSEQTNDVYQSLNPKILLCDSTLKTEMEKAKKENAKHDYQVNDLTEEMHRLSELTQAFFARSQNLHDFIGGT